MWNHARNEHCWVNNSAFHYLHESTNSWSDTAYIKLLIDILVLKWMHEKMMDLKLKTCGKSWRQPPHANFCYLHKTSLRMIPSQLLIIPNTFPKLPRKKQNFLWKINIYTYKPLRVCLAKSVIPYQIKLNRLQYVFNCLDLGLLHCK